MSATAAFIRAEGLLFPRGWLLAPAYLSANDQAIRARLMRLAVNALIAPMGCLLSQRYRRVGTRALHTVLRGMTEDRIFVLGEEYVEDVLHKSVLEGGRQILREARADGHRVVLVSDNVEEVAEPLARHVEGVDEVVCNHLDYHCGRATGGLRFPVLGGVQSRRWLRRYADENTIDLTHSCAFASYGTDKHLLEAVGQATAVNPDRTLRQVAQDAGWTILHYDN